MADEDKVKIWYQIWYQLSGWRSGYMNGNDFEILKWTDKEEAIEFLQKRCHEMWPDDMFSPVKHVFRLVKLTAEEIDV